MIALDLFCGAGGTCVGLQRAGFRVVGVDCVRQPDYPGEFILGDALQPPVDIADFDLVWASPPCQAYSSGGFFARRQGVEYPDLMAATREALGGHPVTVIENVPGAPMRADLTLTLPMFENFTMRRKRIFELTFPCWQPWPKKAPPAIVEAFAGGCVNSKTKRTGASDRRGACGLFTAEHIRFIAEVQPEFYRRHFAGLVSTFGNTGRKFEESGVKRISTRRREMGMPMTTTHPELRAALDCPHIKTGSYKRVRKGLNNAVPPAYSEYIGRQALKFMEA